jgi:hypothetical protein
MKRKFDEDSLCSQFESMMKPPVKKVKTMIKCILNPFPFPLWKNIFSAPNFEKKNTYTYSEVCEILNKHDNHLMNEYLEIQKQDNSTQICKVHAIK